MTNGKATATGGSIVTTGTGANGAFATGSSASVELNSLTISGKSDGAHAVMATQGGTMVLNNVDMTTTGGSSSAVATDRGGGTITVNGGTVTTSGGNSATIYSTGSITANNITGKSTGAEMTVIEGANSITLNNCALTSTKEKWGPHDLPEHVGRRFRQSRRIHRHRRIDELHALFGSRCSTSTTRQPSSR